jgi:hypothetical protein
MATLTYAVDPSSDPLGRQCTWNSDDFDADDVLDVEASMRRCGSRLDIEAAADANTTVLLNAVRKVYGVDSDVRRYGIAVPDWSTEGTVTNSRAIEVVVASGETVTVTDVPIRTITISAVTKGSGNGVDITVR